MPVCQRPSEALRNRAPDVRVVEVHRPLRVSRPKSTAPPQRPAVTFPPDWSCLPGRLGGTRVRERWQRGGRLALACAGLAVATLLACGRAPLPGTGPPPLRVGVAPGYPPVVFERDGEVIGIEADLARQLGAELDRRVRFVERDFDRLIPSLEAGEIDVIMSGMSVTEERAARVLFTEPYMRVGQLALIRKADVGRLGPPDALHRHGRRVGYVRGTTGAAFVRSRLPRSEAYGFDTVEDGLRQLRAGRIEYLIHDAPTAWRVALAPDEDELMGLYHPLTEEYLAWAVARDDVALKRELDAILDDWRANDRLQPVLDRWIPLRVSLRD